MHATKHGTRASRGMVSVVLVAAIVASTLGLTVDVARAATPPGAPTAVNAVPGKGSATVSWTPPTSNGGQPITGYAVTPIVGWMPMATRTFTSTATTQVITGMVDGWTYRVKVTAINSMGIGTESVVSNAFVPGSVAPPTPTTFTHPGVLMGKADLDLVRSKVAAGQQPWKAAYDKVLTTGGSIPTTRRPTSYRYASLSYKAAPVKVIQDAAGSSTAYMEAHPELGLANIGGVEHLDDTRAAYTHALLWYYSGNRAHATKAIEIMNAWSSTLTEIKFDQPRRLDNSAQVYSNGKLQAGWGGSMFARAAEIIRYSGAGWSSSDATRFGTMLHNVYRPLVITGWSNGANWMMTFAEATIAIGVYTDNRATFDAGVAMWRDRVPTTIYMATDGPLPDVPAPHYDTPAEIKALWYNPTSFVTGLQGETLRDLSHMAFGLGAMSNAAATARLQGVDLFQEEQARIVAAFERNAAYVNAYLDKKASLGGAEPPSNWMPSGWVGATFRTGGTGYGGGWEVAYRHYAKVVGISMPNTERLVARLRPSQPQVHLLWETLTHAR